MKKVKFFGYRNIGIGSINPDKLMRTVESQINDFLESTQNISIVDIKIQLADGALIAALIYESTI